MSRPTPDEQAADWLVRHDRGLTPAEQDEYLQWLAADPLHGEALARQQATWRELDLLADWRPEHAPEPNPALLAPPPPPRRVSRPSRWLAPAALAAAACVALVFFLNRAPRASVPLVATAPVTAVPPAVATRYEKRLLDDGSVLELNRGASVSIHYTAAERRVRLLAGEARFTVAKNPARPFVVSAAGVETRAIGTAFNVRLAAASVEVLVTEGRVQVTPAAPASPAAAPAIAAPAPLVARGERITIPLAPPPSSFTTPPTTPLAAVPVAATAEELARALAWQPRRLEFSSAPLAEVVAEFNRHNLIQLSLADPALANFPVTASFRSDNVEGFVRLLEATADIRAVRRAETISLRAAISP